MKIEITNNGKKVYHEIPTSWDQISFRKFLAIQECKDDFVKVMALLTGIDYDIIRVAKIKNLDSVLTSVNFIFTQPVNKKPTSILGFSIPKDLGFETIAQFEDIKMTLKNAKEMTEIELIMKYPLYCAIYSCKPYDWKKAEEMQEIFFNAPCQEVLGIGNFTLLKLIGLNLSTALSSRQQPTRLKKFRRALTVFRFRLGFILRSFTWKKKPAPLVKSY